MHFRTSPPSFVISYLENTACTVVRVLSVCALILAGNFTRSKSYFCFLWSRVHGGTTVRVHCNYDNSVCTGTCSACACSTVFRNIYYVSMLISYLYRPVYLCFVHIYSNYSCIVHSFDTRAVVAMCCTSNSKFPKWGLAATLEVLKAIDPRVCVCVCVFIMSGGTNVH